MRKNLPIDKKEINNLVKEISCGNEQAFDLLYTKMKKIIYYFLLRYNLSKDEIEDIISSTFLTVIEKSKTKIVFKNCFSWIITIAKYKLYNYNRKKQKITYDSDSIDRCGTNINQNNMAFKYEIEKMDKQTQQILFYNIYAKFTYDQIAKILHISVSTIKRRKNEALQHLKETYRDE